MFCFSSHLNRFSPLKRDIIDRDVIAVYAICYHFFPSCANLTQFAKVDIVLSVDQRVDELPLPHRYLFLHRETFQPTCPTDVIEVSEHSRHGFSRYLCSLSPLLLIICTTGCPRYSKQIPSMPHLKCVCSSAMHHPQSPDFCIFQKYGKHDRFNVLFRKTQVLGKRNLTFEQL